MRVPFNHKPRGSAMPYLGADGLCQLDLGQFSLDRQDFPSRGRGADVHHEDFLLLQLLHLRLLAALLGLDAEKAPKQVEANLHLREDVRKIASCPQDLQRKRARHDGWGSSCTVAGMSHAGEVYSPPNPGGGYLSYETIRTRQGRIDLCSNADESTRDGILCGIQCIVVRSRHAYKLDLRTSEGGMPLPTFRSLCSA